MMIDTVTGSLMRRFAIAASVAALLTGCTLIDAVKPSKGDDSKEAAPKSQRISILELEQKLEADPRIADLDVTLPEAKPVTEWTQPGGTPVNALHHIALPTLPSVAEDPKAALKVVWQIEAGEGSTSITRLTAPPIVVDNRVYVLDSEATVRAFDADTGELYWTSELTHEDEDQSAGFGGGLAADLSMVYAVTGFGTIHAMSSGSGDEVWRRSVGVPIRSAPSATNGRLFVTATDNQIHAYDAATGLSLWNQRALAETAGLLSSVSAAVDSQTIVAPFSSGEVKAFRLQNGRETWSDTLNRTGRATALAGINDIAARPVIDGDRVFAVSHSGRMVSIDKRTGERVWTRNIGGIQTPWVAGDFIYMVTVDQELICVSRRDGRIRWLTRMKRFKDQEDKEGAVTWYGPVLVNERLLLVNSLGEIAFMSPKDGQVMKAFKAHGETYIAPVVAAGKVFILSDDGTLTAYQ